MPRTDQVLIGVCTQVWGDPDGIVVVARDPKHGRSKCKLGFCGALGDAVFDDLHGDGVAEMGVDAGHGDAVVGLGELERGEEDEEGAEKVHLVGVELETSCGK